MNIITATTHSSGTPATTIGTSAADALTTQVQQQPSQGDWRKQLQDFIAMGQFAMQAASNSNAAVQQIGKKQWENIQQKIVTDFGGAAYGKVDKKSSHKSSPYEKKEKDPMRRRDALRIFYKFYELLYPNVKFSQTRANKWWGMTVDNRKPVEARARSAFVACGILEAGKKTTTNKMLKEELEALVASKLDQFRQLCAQDIALYEQQYLKLYAQCELANTLGTMKDEENYNKIAMALLALPHTVVAEMPAAQVVASAIATPPVSTLPSTSSPVPSNGPISQPALAVAASETVPSTIHHIQHTAAASMLKAQQSMVMAKPHVAPAPSANTVSHNDEDDGDASSTTSESDSDSDDEESTQMIEMELAKEMQ